MARMLNGSKGGGLPGWKAIIFATLTILAAATAFAANSASILSTQQPTKWVIAVYMVADNNLDPYAIYDIDLMEAGVTSNATIVVFIDRAEKPIKEGVPEEILKSSEATPFWSGARVLLLVHDKEPGLRLGDEVVQDLGEVNSGSPETLAKFLEFVKEKFTGEHYMLILWDHGGGPGLFGVDEDTGGERDYLTPREIREALITSGFRPEIIYVDACSIGMVELAYDLSDTSSYLIASESLVPSSALDYSSALPAVAKLDDPLKAAETLAKMYFEGLTHTAFSDIAQVSVVNLTGFRDSELIKSLKMLSQEIVSDPAPAALVRRYLRGFTSPLVAAGVTETVDIAEFASSIRDSYMAAEEVLKSIHDVVILSKSGGDLAGVGGLSIFYPIYFDRNLYDKATDFGHDTGWSDALEAIVAESQASLKPLGNEVPLGREYLGKLVRYLDWSSVAVGDIDGDGADEIVVQMIGSNGSTYYGVLSVIDYINNSLKEVATTIDYESSYEPYEIAADVGDFDGDGIDEIAVVWSRGPLNGLLSTVTIYKFENGLNRTAQTSMDSVALIDFSIAQSARFGYVIATIGYSVSQNGVGARLYLINPTDTPPLRAVLDLGNASLRTVSAGDVDGDGNDEILVDALLNNTSTLILYFTLNGSKKIVVKAGEGTEITSAALGDVDGDGKDELVFATINGSQYSITVKGVGKNVCSYVRRLPTTNSTIFVQLFDIDGDGLDEVIVSMASFSGTGGLESLKFIIMSYSQNACLSISSSINMKEEYKIPFAADVNGDGETEDLYLRQSAGAVFVSLAEISIAENVTILGTVLTATGDPVPGARVTVGVPGGPVVTEAVTDSNGHFVITVAPGTYVVRAEAQIDGHEYSSYTTVSLRPGEKKNVSIELPILSTLTPVTTTTSSVQVATGSTTLVTTSTQTTSAILRVPQPTHSFIGIVVAVLTAVLIFFILRGRPTP